MKRVDVIRAVLITALCLGAFCLAVYAWLHPYPEGR